MRLYLIRHGIAEDLESSPTGRDDGRRLTAEGERRLRREAAALDRLDLRPEKLVTSPLERARATADVLAAGLGGLAVEIDPALASGAAPGAMVGVVRKHRALGSLALVGHEPDLGDLSSFLAFGTPETSLPLRKGGVACFDVDLDDRSCRGRLFAFLPPALLLRI